MSAIPTGDGGVSINFTPDRTAVDAFLAELRRGFTIPLKADFIGPTGAPGGGMSAASIATSPTGVGSGGSGPATFANPTGPSAFVGPGSFAAAMGGAFTVGGPGFGLTGSSAALSGPVTQLGQAAGQLAQAAQQLTSAAGRMGGGPAVGPSAGNQRFAGLSTSGLARYVGLGFLAHEGLSVAQSYRQYLMETGMAAGPTDMAQAEMGLYSRFSHVPIFGQAADMLTDPTGNNLIGINATMAGANQQLAFSGYRYALRSRTAGMERQANVAGNMGYARSLASAEAGYQAELQRINDERSGPAAQSRYRQLDELLATKRAAINAQYGEELRGLRPAGPGGVPDISATSAVIARQNAALSSAEGDVNKLRRAVDDEFERQREAARRMRDATLRDIHAAGESRATRYSYEGDIYREQVRQFPRQWYIRSAERQEDIAEEADVYRTEGPGSAREWGAMQHARRQEQYSNYDRSVLTERARFMGQAESSWQAARNNPLAAHLTNLYSEFQQQVINTRNTQLVGPGLAAFGGGVLQTLMGAWRSNADFMHGLQSSAQTLDALIHHDPLGAQLNEIGSQRYETLRQIERLPQIFQGPARYAANTLYGRREQYARQQFEDTTNEIRARIESDTRSANLRSGYDPASAGQPRGVRNFLADLNDMVSGIQEQQRTLARSGHWQEALDLGRKEGIARLNEFREQLYATHDMMVNPFMVVPQSQARRQMAGIDRALQQAATRLRTEPDISNGSNRDTQQMSKDTGVLVTLMKQLLQLLQNPGPNS